MVACKKCRVEVTVFEYAKIFGEDLCVSCINEFVDKMLGRIKAASITSTPKTRSSPHRAWKMVVEKSKHSLVNFKMPPIVKADVMDYQKMLAQEIQRSQYGLKEAEKVWVRKTGYIGDAYKHRDRRLRNFLRNTQKACFVITAILG